MTENKFSFQYEKIFLQQMAYVYLIGQNGDNDYYKIGSTRAKDLNKRLKQLQTGNSNQLYIKHSFQTDTPFKLERMLHFHFNESHELNEWFGMTKEQINAFIPTCKRLQSTIDSLVDNPYFNDKKSRQNEKESILD